MQVYDIGDLTNVRLVETMSFPGICFETALDGGLCACRALVALGCGIHDVSAAPAAELGGKPIPTADHGVFAGRWSGFHLADGDGGYQIVGYHDLAPTGRALADGHR
ncbi:MAG: hypothetical protein IPO18_06275 [bacterium]|nr:hypothetical protein [bacterium]